ncbi:MAG TPA: DUF1501 domain-containing protein [Acidimicrobiales bacterium]|nr:DUF1501 domain-containing protein [Acidimicrobiales bacterium]
MTATPAATPCHRCHDPDGSGGGLDPRGRSRRRLLVGAGAAGLALGTGLGRARVSFAAQPGGGTLVVLFLRGGMDGLSALVPVGDPHLAAARPDIAVPASAALPLDRTWGLHPALSSLHQLWRDGRCAAVPAVSTPDISRSHFQAQDCLERGGSATGATSGWLNRALESAGPGTPLQALTVGKSTVRSLVGERPTTSLRALDALSLRIGDEARRGRAVEALRALHEGVDHPLAADARTAVDAMGAAQLAAAVAPEPGADYPDDDLGTQLRDVARLVKADVGLRVACIDVGGWDTHVGQGTVDGGTMADRLGMLDRALDAFVADLGPAGDAVTVVVMTEFGRRVEQNASRGTDHGHGATVLLVGGGLAGGRVHGTWHGLAPEVLDDGDVPGWNDYRDVLAEVVTMRLGVPAGSLGDVFPGHRPQPLGVTA